MYTWLLCVNTIRKYAHLLQISEMYSSGGELHIELMTGQPQGSKSLWVSGSIDKTRCMSVLLHACATHYSDTCTVNALCIIYSNIIIAIL